MSDPEFFQTQMGRRFFEGTMPALVEELKRLNRNLERLATAAPPPGSGSTTKEWQPIETAPKDGTEILLTDGHWKRTGYWAKRAEVWSVDTAVTLKDPTHWTPIPLPDQKPDPDDQGSGEANTERRLMT